MLEQLKTLYNGEQLPLDTDSEEYCELVNYGADSIEEMYLTGIKHGEAKAYKRIKEMIEAHDSSSRNNPT